MTARDVLVLESSPGAERHDAELREAAGHRALRATGRTYGQVDVNHRIAAVDGPAQA